MLKEESQRTESEEGVRLTLSVYWALFYRFFPRFKSKSQHAHREPHEQMHAVQLHERSQREHARVIAMPPVISWIIGASKDVIIHLLRPKPQEPSFTPFYPSYHTSQPSARPVSSTFKIYSELNLSDHLYCYQPTPSHCHFQPGRWHRLLPILSHPTLAPQIYPPRNHWRSAFHTRSASCHSLTVDHLHDPSSVLTSFAT